MSSHYGKISRKSKGQDRLRRIHNRSYANTAKEVTKNCCPIQFVLSLLSDYDRFIREVRQRMEKAEATMNERLTRIRALPARRVQDAQKELEHFQVNDYRSV